MWKILIIPVVVALNFRFGANVNQKKFMNNNKPGRRTARNVNTDEEHCQCSVPTNPILMIVGGQGTTPHQFPWMVGLMPGNSTQVYCGGVLINDLYVLTAAHCLFGRTESHISLVLGADNLRYINKPPAFRISPANFSLHPAWDNLTYDNDIALIKLEKHITFSYAAHPICLPKEGEDYTGQIATVIGWGLTGYGLDYGSDELQKVDIPIHPVEECKLNDTERNLTTIICAFWKEGEKDSCTGDSGGPMMIKGEERRWELIGIVSWGQNCAHPGAVASYTLVNRFLQWLSTETADASHCNK